MHERELHVGLAVPGDARGLVALIRRGYGDTYCLADRLDPVVVPRPVAEGALAYAVLRTAQGEAALDALGVPHHRSEERGTSHDDLGVTIETDRTLGLTHLRFGSGGRTRRLDPGFLDGIAASGQRVVWADVPAEHAGASHIAER